MASKTIHSTVRIGESENRRRKLIFVCVLAWSADPGERTLIAFSPASAFQVDLPSGGAPAFSLQLVVYIRDAFGSTAEQNLSSISVFTDPGVVTDLIDDLQQSPDQLQSNPSIRSLLTGNQNQVGQLISSLSQQLNQLSDHNIELAASSNCIPMKISSYQTGL